MEIKNYLEKIVKDNINLNVRTGNCSDSIEIVLYKPMPEEYRPNKKSANIFLKFTRECIDDYFGGFEFDTVAWDEDKLKNTIKNKVNSVLENDDLYSAHSINDQPREIQITIDEI